MPDESNRTVRMLFAKRSGVLPFREVLYKSLGKPTDMKQGLSQEVRNFLIVMNQKVASNVSQ
ncbi:Transcription termination factor Rho [Burkholderia ambifaria]